ncbi:hypothetical protein MMC26_002054 [Xylographa opegraphella]|nr:hypothetical protein [Xylographa opegraphella]
MDSMRSLNKSLPPASPKPRMVTPPESLLQAFRTAALSMTNLYKTAAVEQKEARQSGYQDALDDLLVFLDKENLGLGDGEGWRVRQWATERLDGTPPAPTGSDSDEDRAEPEKRTGSSSPVLRQKHIPESTQRRSPSRSSSPARPEDASAPPPPLSVPPPATFQAPTDCFTFRSVHQLPQDTDMQSGDAAQNPNTQTDPGAPAVRVEFTPRSSRTALRHSNLSNRHINRSSTSVRTLGSGAGSKRRVTFGDFFDISNLGDSKDLGPPAGKRSRPN